ncbi:MAG: hypothetical protein RLZZ362_2490 [Actinomycetota bacterium]
MKQHRVVVMFGVLTGLFAAGYGVMFTVLDDFRDQYGIGEAWLGAIVALGFFSSFFAQVLLAPLADRGHARRMVYIGMALDVAGLLTMAFGRTVAVLLVARVASGIGAGLALPAIRRMVVVADRDNIGSNLGRMLAFDVIGFAMGPAISAVLVGPFGIAAPFIVISVATVACLPLVSRVHVPEAGDEGVAIGRRFAFDLLRMRPFLGALSFGAAVFIMIGTFDALWVLVLDDLDTADWIANVGITFFAVPMVFLASRGGRLAQRVGPFRVATVGLSVATVMMFLYGRMPSGGAMLAVVVFHAISDGLTVSSPGIAVGMVVAEERQAGAQGMLGGVQTLVGGIAALVAGSLYQHHGRTTAYTVCAITMALLVIAGSWLSRGSKLGDGRAPGELPSADASRPADLSH